MRPFAGIGDIDGDGYPDFLISDEYKPGPPRDASGQVLLIFGAPDYPESVDLNDPGASGVRSLRFFSSDAERNAGKSLSIAGDLNGDGKTDLAIGGDGPGTRNGLYTAGLVHVVFGGFDLNEDIELVEVGKSVPGFILRGAYGNAGVDTEVGDWLAVGDNSLAPAGDLNGDGFDDFLAGAFEATRAVRRGGAVYVIYGRPDMDGDGRIDLVIGGEFRGTLDQTYILFGRQVWPSALRIGRERAESRAAMFPSQGCGLALVAAPGDLDGDEVGDLLLSNRGLCNNFPVRLQRGPFAPGRTIARPGSMILGGSGPMRFGSALGPAGDMNGDGLGDFLIGAADDDASIAQCYIVLGRDGGYSDPSAMENLIASGSAVRLRRGLSLSQFGEVVAPAGDFNGDKLADAFIGVPGGGRDFHGEAHVVFGSRELGRSVKEIDLAVEGPSHLRIDGEHPYDWSAFGREIGDWNGDGLIDIAIMGNYHRNTRPRAYVVFGQANPPLSINLRNLGGGGFRILGQEQNRFLNSVTGGDFNGDKAADIAWGEETPDGNRVVVIFGKGGESPRFVRGEVNGDGSIDISDAVRILEFLFLGGEEIECQDAADVDDSGSIDITEPIAILGHLFLGDPAPPAPYPDSGPDPTPDALACF